MKKQVVELTAEEFIRVLLGVPRRYELSMKVFDKDGSKEENTLIGTYDDLHDTFVMCMARFKGTPEEKEWEKRISYIEQNLFDYEMDLSYLDIYKYLEYHTGGFVDDKIRFLLLDLDFAKFNIEEEITSDEKGPYRAFMYNQAIGILKSKISNHKPLWPTKVLNTFSAKIISEDKDGTLKLLHSLIDGRRGKNVALVILASVEAGIIQKPTYREVKDEFGDIGAESGYNRYMDKTMFSDGEFNGMLNRLTQV